jgi:biotin carboxyl carrier protein
MFPVADEFVSPNGQHSEPVTVPREKRPSNVWLIIVAALFIIVPFLTWYLTWFGRGLSDEDLANYLVDEKNPRHIQHALLQVEDRIEKGEPSAKKFYPQIISASKSSVAEVRKTAAWVMGQDNKSEEFHNALLPLLKDDEPLVRRNAALQLVRFGDASGRPELRAMLQPFEAKSPMGGTLVGLLPAGSSIRAGAMLARIRDSANDVYEFRSPVDGKTAWPPIVKEGDHVGKDQTIARLLPDHAGILDALRALAYVGTKDDLMLVDDSQRIDATAEIANQVAQTTKAIRSRSEAGAK